MNLAQQRFGFWILALILLCTSIAATQSAFATSTDNFEQVGYSQFWSLRSGMPMNYEEAGTETYFANLDQGWYTVTNKGEGAVIATETDIEEKPYVLKKGESHTFFVTKGGIIHIELAEKSTSARGSFDGPN